MTVYCLMTDKTGTRIHGKPIFSNPWKLNFPVWEIRYVGWMQNVTKRNEEKKDLASVSFLQVDPILIFSEILTVQFGKK